MFLTFNFHEKLYILRLIRRIILNNNFDIISEFNFKKSEFRLIEHSIGLSDTSCGNITLHRTIGYSYTAILHCIGLSDTSCGSIIQSKRCLLNFRCSEANDQA